MEARTPLPACVRFILIAVAFLATSPGLCLDAAFSSRELAIDLGENISTDGMLTTPAAGNGTYPGVLIVQGGPQDMDGFIPPQITGSGEPSRPFMQVAEYLSNRGFVVLRYNARGMAAGNVVANASAVDNTTFGAFLEDADRALDALTSQPEVDSSDITIIGHGEGTATAVGLAGDRPEVDKTVLLAPFAGDFLDILHFRMVERLISYAQDEMDGNGDGLLTIEEMVATIGRNGEDVAPLQAGSFVEGINNTYRWYPGLDANGDGSVSIRGELVPIFENDFVMYMSDPSAPGYSWIQSAASAPRNIDAVGDLGSSILIVHGEGDIEMPVEESYLLEQRLTAVRHHDHTLITYPWLGYSFYPASGWIQPLGPIQSYVLSDVHAWLKDPDRYGGDADPGSSSMPRFRSPAPETEGSGAADDGAGEEGGDGVIDRIGQMGSDLWNRAGEGLEDARGAIGGLNLSMNLSSFSLPGVNLSSMNISSMNVSMPDINASGWLSSMNGSIQGMAGTGNGSK